MVQAVSDRPSNASTFAVILEVELGKGSTSSGHLCSRCDRHLYDRIQHLRRPCMIEEDVTPLVFRLL